MAHDCAHDEGSGQGLSGPRLAEALADADARCAAARERLTSPRRRVLELLLSADSPLKAYDMIAAFGTDGVPAKPPTVYRALDFLEKQGFAHRIESLNAYVPCRIQGGAHRAAFLICDCCGAAREFEPGLEAGLSAAAEAGYSVRSLTLEARGLCPACREA
ncbi:Fur family transcriptional regulator [Phenylobacterium sp.]|jgi:Fur family zinc uptake transcriptional regulator|uniref:Fur family transcriptional regulator n=1 Tax=Phenylobacterium sp. TaxID=1871053 RepID=UPI0025FA020B|nr:Fur family transcriptional regulator [Phenylobacterium sp.]MCA3720107.1 transcriptional repressor [Phenylobacterium sp.]